MLLLMLFWMGFIFERAFADSTFYYFTKEAKSDTVVYQIQRIDSIQVGLALSGGGARGAAHLGIMQGVEEIGLPLSQIVGSSIGSVIAALYVAGYSPSEILEILRNYDWSQIYNDRSDRTDIIISQKKEMENYFITLRINENGPYIPISLSSGQKLLFELHKYTFPLSLRYSSDYSRMPVPIKIVSTDLISGNKVVLKEGSVGLNLLSSMAYPLIFSPVIVHDQLLIDGGIAENIPLSELDSTQTIRLVSDVTAGLRDESSLKAPWQIADQVTTILMKASNPTLRPNDILFSPEVKQFSSTSFQYLPYFFRLGYETFSSEMPVLEMRLSEVTGKPIQFEYLTVEQFVLEIDSSRYRYLLDTLICPNSFVKKVEKLTGNKIGVLYYLPEERTFIAKMENARFFPFAKVLVDSLPVIFEQLMNNANIDHFMPSIHPDISSYYQTRLEKMGYMVNVVDRRPSGDTLKLSYRSVLLDSVEILTAGKKTRPYVIRREIPLQKGSKLSRDVLLQSMKNIYGLDLFTQVDFHLKQMRNGRANLLVEFNEKPFHSLKVGFHADKNLKGEIAFKYLYNNILGHQFTFTIDGLIGTTRRDFHLSFSTLRLGYSQTGLNFSFRNSWKGMTVYENRRNNGAFSHRTSEFRIGLLRFLEKLGSTSFHLFWREDKAPVSLEDLLQKKQYHSYGFRLESIYDKRSTVPVSESGTYFRFLTESFTIQQEGQKFQTNRAIINLQLNYHPAKFTYFQPFANIALAENQTPFFLWFATENWNRKSGWNLYEFYGKLVNIFGITIYQKIFPYFWGEKYLFIRGDFGNLWRDSEQKFRWQDLEAGGCIGLMFSTIAGPVSISYEFRENFQPYFWFSLGFEY